MKPRRTSHDSDDGDRVAAALTLLAPAARANWNVKAKLLCYEASNQNDALTYDSDTRELHVINRCDESVVQCDLSNHGVCSSSTRETSSKYKTNRACTDELLNIGASEVEGSMLCLENEGYSFSSHKFSFGAACQATLEVDGLPCVLAFKSGKLFKESAVCPTAQ